MSRDDLVSTNERIVAQVTEAAVVQSPEAILVVVSNPLDAMCHVAKNVSGWPKERVFGMAGILDTARFSTFIAWETGASVKDVTAMMLDEKRVLPCTAYLEGEYGIDGLYMGVPVKLGHDGIEEVVELELSGDEQTMLNESADAVREVVGVLTT